MSEHDELTVLFPVEPTEEMMLAGDAAILDGLQKALLGVTDGLHPKHASWNVYMAMRAANLGSMRLLYAHDAFCPSCGHNRDKSSISTISYANEIKECQMCGCVWQEPNVAAMQINRESALDKPANPGDGSGPASTAAPDRRKGRRLGSHFRR